MKNVFVFLATLCLLSMVCGSVESGEAKSLDIFDAVRSGNIEKVKEVLDIEPSSLYFRRNNGVVPGYTPLHLAASQGDCRMVLFILERGIPADIRAQDLTTPLQMAIQYSLSNDYSETIIALLKYKADINAINSYQQTALDLAIHHGNPEMVDFLSLLGARRGKLFRNIDPIEIAP